MRLSLLMLLAALGLTASLLAQEDVADVPAEDLRVGKDASKRYFLIGPHKGSQAPEAGHGLILVLPGGAGNHEFHSFVKRIFKHSVPQGYLAAQLVAPRWTEDQEIIWPTAKVPTAKMKFTTEEFIAAVLADVRARHKIDASRVFVLAWSSGGPAAYAASLSDKGIKGSLIAMSVFKPKLLPPLEKAKGHVYYLYHSREDRTCPFRMAEQAERELSKHGAKVKLASYRGGHGWRAGFFDHLRTGFKTLEDAARKQKGKKD